MTYYVLPNYRNRAAMVNGLRAQMHIKVFTLEPDGIRDGEVTVTGPNYPETPQWTARVRVADGEVVRVL